MELKEEIKIYLEKSYPGMTVAIDGNCKLTRWVFGILNIDELPTIIILKPGNGYVGLALETIEDRNKPLNKIRSYGFDSYFVYSIEDVKMIVDRHLSNP